MRYECDFGDGWRHPVLVERVLRLEPGDKGAVCLAGDGACPPEDCGGIGGYEQLLATLRRGHGEDYQDMLDWLGGPFDPAAFDVATVSRTFWQLR